jgi:hypothetical protein
MTRQPPVLRLRFNVGPSYKRDPDGTYEEMSEVLHVWTPRR